MTDMPNIDEQFLSLLTDALRSGPGSPAWHEAVARLRAANVDDADEYRLLLTAREHLESGREYRSIRPGPNFTRKVMDAINREPAGRAPAAFTAGVIAIIAALAALTVIIIIAIALSRGTTPGPTLSELEATYFAKPVVSSDFAMGIPAEWRTFGVDVVAGRMGLQGGATRNTGSQFAGGGLYLANAIAGGQAFAVESRVRVERSSRKVDLQLFVTQDPKFDRNANATTSAEAVVDIVGGQVSVFKPDGKLAGVQARVADRDLALLIKMNSRFIIVEYDRQTLYAGEHGLSPDKPCWPGIRFVTSGENSTEDVTIQMVRVLKP